MHVNPSIIESDLFHGSNDTYHFIRGSDNEKQLNIKYSTEGLLNSFVRVFGESLCIFPLMITVMHELEHVDQHPAQTVGSRWLIWEDHCDRYWSPLVARLWYTDEKIDTQPPNMQWWDYLARYTWGEQTIGSEQKQVNLTVFRFRAQWNFSEIRVLRVFKTMDDTFASTTLHDS